MLIKRIPVCQYIIIEVILFLLASDAFPFSFLFSRIFLPVLRMTVIYVLNFSISVS